jgi:hypothetical protein
VYRAIFTKLAEWYALGSPVLGSIQFVLKMKSLSKIYELFTFYHIFEELIRDNWVFAKSAPHPEFGEFMIKTAVFMKGAETITVDYEPMIGKLGNATRHGDLVDVAHRSSAERPYWMPDFVLKWEKGVDFGYLILDAKYSGVNSVRQYAIPAIYSKYYEGTAVYNAVQRNTSSAAIVAVIAVYALEWNTPRYISKWEYQGIFSATPRIPAIGGIGLMTDNDEFFRECFSKLIGMTRQCCGVSSPPSNDLRLVEVA